MNELMLGSLEDLRFGLLRHCEEQRDEVIQMNYGLPRFACNDMTSLPNEGGSGWVTTDSSITTLTQPSPRRGRSLCKISLYPLGRGCPKDGRGAKAAFTLAEVLITLAIIGVVAAMTIPTLITKMSQRAAEARQKTIEARLLDGINRYSALEDGLSQHYETTYDFLVGLSKHYKMAQICKADEITNCIPYSTITYTSNNEDATVDVASLTSIDNFMGEGKDDYLAPASFITAQGTPVIMAFKKDCAWDMGKAMRSIQDSGCIAYMYDESGTRNPNKLGKDIIAHGLTIVVDDLGGAIAKVGGYKIMEQAFVQQTGLTSAECEEEADKAYGIIKDNCGGVSDDRWAAAMKYCHDKGYRLPNEQESLAIVQGLFKDTNGNHPSGSYWDSNTYKIDLDLVSTLGLKNWDDSSITQDVVDSMSFWGSVESSWYDAFFRSTVSGGSNWVDDGRHGVMQVLCID